MSNNNYASRESLYVSKISFFNKLNGDSNPTTLSVIDRDKGYRTLTIDYGIPNSSVAYFYYSLGEDLLAIFFYTGSTNMYLLYDLNKMELIDSKDMGHDEYSIYSYGNRIICRNTYYTYVSTMNGILEINVPYSAPIAMNDLYWFYYNY